MKPYRWRVDFAYPPSVILVDLPPVKEGERLVITHVGFYSSLTATRVLVILLQGHGYLHPLLSIAFGVGYSSYCPPQPLVVWPGEYLTLRVSALAEGEKGTVYLTGYILGTKE